MVNERRSRVNAIPGDGGNCRCGFSTSAPLASPRGLQRVVVRGVSICRASDAPPTTRDGHSLQAAIGSARWLRGSTATAPTRGVGGFCHHGTMSTNASTRGPRATPSGGVVLAQLLLGAVVLVVASSVVLSLWWLPSAPGVSRSLLPRRNADALKARDLQTTAVALVAITGAATAGFFSLSRSVRRSRIVPALALATLLLAGALLVVRRMMLWDQLALWAVTTNFEAGRGAWWPARSDTVRFILVGHSEVSKGQYLFVTIVHTVVLPGLMLASAAGAAWLSRRRSALADTAL